MQSRAGGAWGGAGASGAEPAPKRAARSRRPPGAPGGDGDSSGDGSDSSSSDDDGATGTGRRRKKERKLGDLKIPALPASTAKFPQWYVEMAQAVQTCVNRADHKVLLWLHKAQQVETVQPEELAISGRKWAKLDMKLRP